MSEATKRSWVGTTCGTCGQPGHRYGATDREHKPNAVGCVNTLREVVERLERENTALREAVATLMYAQAATIAAEHREAWRRTLSAARNLLDTPSDLGVS